MSGTHSTTTHGKASKSRSKPEPVLAMEKVKKTVKKNRRIAGPALSNNPVMEEARHHMISEAAYYLAERRGFADGDPVEDWLEAEAQIDSMLTSDEDVDDSMLMAGIDRSGAIST